MNTRIRNGICAGIVAVSALGGAALADTTVSRTLAAKGYSVADPIHAVPGNTIDTWDYVDDRNLIVRRGHDGHYLVTLATPCPALQTAGTIGFNAAITPGLHDAGELVVGHTARAPSCEIAQVFELDRPTG